MKVIQQEKTLILVPETNLTAGNIEELRDYFRKQLKQHSDIVSVILNVSGVHSVDSLGVNLIVGLYREVTEKSGTIEIVGAEENFMKVANFFRLSSLFPIRRAEK
jgi:anti-anti-sigma factor